MLAASAHGMLDIIIKSARFGLQHKYLLIYCMLWRMIFRSVPAGEFSSFCLEADYADNLR